MPRLPSLAASYLVQLILVATGVLLVLLYLAMFGDPPYPALVPAAFWFFYLAYLSLRWLMRRLSGGRASWQQSMAFGIAAALTIAIYLAGHIGEQQRQASLQERQLSD